MYASPPTRTPPLLQTVLQQSGLLFVVPASIFFLGDKKKYCHWMPMLAALLVIGSVAMSVAPTVSSSGSTMDGGTSAAWIAVYFAGTAPGALLNILQQRYFMQLHALREDTTQHEIVTTSLRCLFYGNLWQTVRGWRARVRVCGWLPGGVWRGVRGGGGEGR